MSTKTTPSTKESPASFNKKMLENHVDGKVGFRIKLRRGMLRLTQEELAKKLGITFQQVQKYETGKDRVSSSRLWDLANALDVPVSFFFEDLVQNGDVLQFAAPKKGNKNTSQSESEKEDELTELIRAYLQIKEDAVKKHLLELAKSLAGRK